MQQYNPKRLMAAAGIVLLSACGGGAGSPPTVEPAGHAGSGAASFILRIPASTTQQLRPQYVSPNAATMQLAIIPADPAGTSVQQTLDLNGPACTMANGVRTCTVTLTLAAGRYTASVSMFASGGALLSQAQNLPVTINPNQTTPVDLSLNGIPAAFQVTAPSGLNGSLANGYSIASPVTITVQTLDASGATIVGTGAPSVAVTSSNAAFSISSATSAGSFTITPPPPAVSDTATTVTLAATIPGATQPALTKQFSLKRHTALLFVSNTGANAITGYLLPYTASADPAVTITNGVSFPEGLAADASGNLFAAEYSADNVGEYAPPYTGSAVLFGDQDVGGNKMLLAPFNVAVDKNGTVYASSLFGSYILSFAPPFTRKSLPATEFDTGFGTGAVALEASGNVFTSDWQDGSISVFKPPFSSRVSPAVSLKNPVNTNTVASVPWQMAFDSSGTLWIEWLGSAGSAVQSLRTQHRLTFDQQSTGPAVSIFGSMLTGYSPPFTDGQLPSIVITSGMTKPEGLAVNTNPGPYAGYVFVSNFDTNTVTMYAPPVTSASVGVPLPGRFGGPIALCLDAGGNLYVANATSNTVSVYAPPYTDSKNPVGTIANGISAPFALTVTP